MPFKDRTDAGQRLAQQLRLYAGRENVIVLGIPRGGVPVAFEIAKAFRAELDVFLSRKLGVPGDEELAFGAVAANGAFYLDDAIVRSCGVGAEKIEHIAADTRLLLQNRAELYRRGRAPLSIQSRTVLLVDDGVATGASALAGVHALRRSSPKEIVLAIPVAPRAAVARLEGAADRLVVLEQPGNFFAVGQFYDDFRQTSDSEVIDLLERAASAQKRPAS